MKIRIDASVWGMGDESLPGGEHEVEVSETTAPLLAGAAAAGVLEVLDASDAESALLAGQVQSQEDGEAAYARAQEDGSWQIGHSDQVSIENADGGA